MKLTKPQALLFDWDNTLVDTWPIIHRTLNETLRYMNHPEWTLQEVMSKVKRSMRDSFPEMFAERWKEAADHYQTTYRAHHLEGLEALPGAEDMLKALPESLFIGVVSNKKGPTLREEVSHLRWGGYFDIVLGSDDAERDKPHPAPVVMALREFAEEFGEEVWFIGDSAIDLEVAEATGTTPILYSPTVITDIKHEGFHFAAQVQNHAQLKKLILDHI